MASFEVYLPQNQILANQGPLASFFGGDTEEAPAKFVRDRVSILALIFPMIWLAWHRLWFALAAYGLVALLVLGLSTTRWDLIASLLFTLPAVYVFLEGSNLIGAKLRANGWKLTDVVEADTLEIAELRWFSENTFAEALPENRSRQATSPNSNKRVAVVKAGNDRPEFGLFAEE